MFTTQFNENRFFNHKSNTMQERTFQYTVIAFLAVILLVSFLSATMKKEVTPDGATVITMFGKKLIERTPKTETTEEEV